jgi:hypothetical protein
MNDKALIARRVAQELHDGDRVNLGIGLPTLVAQYLPASVQVFFHSENGIMGMSPLPGEGFEDRNLTDAGGRPVGALPGASAFDSATSFGIIRGGHLDVTVLGGLEVDAQGRLKQGVLEADNARAVRDQLRAGGLTPTAVDESVARSERLAKILERLDAAQLRHCKGDGRAAHQVEADAGDGGAQLGDGLVRAA